VNLRAPLVTDAQAAKLAQPGQGAFHYPAQLSEAVLLCPTPSGDARLDASASELGAYLARVVSLVGHKRARALARPAEWPADGRHGVHKLQSHPGVVSVGRGELYRERHPLPIGQDVAFRARLGPVGGIRARFSPPKTARTEAESATTREKSILSASPRRSSNTRCSFSHTPALCHSLRRRQQVMPLPQPISRGRYSQGMPVRSTYRMPVRHARSADGHLWVLAAPAAEVVR